MKNINFWRNIGVRHGVISCLLNYCEISTPIFGEKKANFKNSCDESLEYHMTMPQIHLYHFLGIILRAIKISRQKMWQNVTFLFTIGNPYIFVNPCNFDALVFRNAKRFFSSTKSIWKKKSYIYRNRKLIFFAPKFQFSRNVEFWCHIYPPCMQPYMQKYKNCHNFTFVTADIFKFGQKLDIDQKNTSW